jgi:2-aminoadipate transaminase
MTNSTTVTAKMRFSQRSQWAGGQPISQLMAQALAHPELISLAAGFVDQATLPHEATRAAADAILSDPIAARAALQYGTTPGYAPLREQILSQLREADGDPASEAGLSVDQIVMTAGSNQLLHLVAETLCNPGDIVLCAAPSYFVFLGTLANLGVRSHGVAADEQGMSPEALDEELARLERTGQLSRVKAIYCTSYFDNPSSVSLSAARRPEIVETAKRWSRQQHIYVIEDAAYRELRYVGDDMPSLRAFDESGETVILAGTFSKSFSPGIRVGWGVLPDSLVDPVCAQKGNFDFGSPNFAQHLMHRVLDANLFAPHVATLRDNYRSKLRAMLDAADEFLGPLDGVTWIRPEGGLYVWLTLPEPIDTSTDGPLFEQALEAGVLYVPGEYCFPSEGERKQNTIRLSFGVQSEQNIRLGMQALGEAIAALL